jgi:hypothetical protein
LSKKRTASQFSPVMRLWRSPITSWQLMQLSLEPQGFEPSDLSATLSSHFPARQRRSCRVAEWGRVSAKRQNKVGGLRQTSFDRHLLRECHAKPALWMKAQAAFDGGDQKAPPKRG